MKIESYLNGKNLIMIKLSIINLEEHPQIKIKAADPNGSYSSFPDKITAEKAAFKLKGPIRCSI